MGGGGLGVTEGGGRGSRTPPSPTTPGVWTPCHTSLEGGGNGQRERNEEETHLPEVLQKYAFVRQTRRVQWTGQLTTGFPGGELIPSRIFGFGGGEVLRGKGDDLNLLELGCTEGTLTLTNCNCRTIQYMSFYSNPRSHL